MSGAVNRWRPNRVCSGDKSKRLTYSVCKIRYSSALIMASGELPEIIDLSGDAPAEPEDEPQAAESRMDIKHYIPLIHRSLRVVLFAFLFLILLRL